MIEYFCAEDWALAVAWPRFWGMTPLSERAPAMAATSAAFWHSSLATAIRPTSMASATAPHSATRLTAITGATLPGRRFRLRENIALLSFQAPGVVHQGMERRTGKRETSGNQLASLSIIEAAFMGKGLGTMPKVEGISGV